MADIYEIQLVVASNDNVGDIEAFAVIDTRDGTVSMVTMHRPIAEMWIQMAESDE